MSTLDTIRRGQQEWARSTGLQVDERGYLGRYSLNLFEPLSVEAAVCFQNGSGNELVGRGAAPAKMSAVHSSSALALNVFHHWSKSPNALLHALKLRLGADKLTFEAQFPTGLAGNPPNLDICVWRADGSIVAVESKFTEWLTPKRIDREYFREKYFPAARGLWDRQRLPCCQATARRIVEGELTFRYLDALQLLKHALGLAASRSPFELCYLYFDTSGREAALHQNEISEFSASLGDDFSFHALTYQQLFERLRAEAQPEHRDYIHYLESRYFH
jgi:hypothetical protein